MHGYLHINYCFFIIIPVGPKNNYYDQLGVCEVITRSGNIERMTCYKRGLPFICKVAAKDAPYDEHCHVFGKSKSE